VPLTFHKVVDREMRRLAKPGRVVSSKWNHYPVALEVLNITLPKQRERFKKGYQELEGLSRDEQARIWIDVWQNSNVMPSLSQSIFFFESWAKEQRRLKARGDVQFAFDPIWEMLTRMVDRVDNWIHSDGLSSLISAAVEERPSERYPLLLKWNRDQNPWRRRQSIVSLHYYARFRERPLPSSKTLPLIRNLLRDEHFYVQRGVGWALRECRNVDPIATLRFLEKHIADIPPIGYFAAVENLDAKTQSRLKAKRLNRRNKK
jgi:3-methyladenine DNA glycosylase AlkD